MLSRCYYVTEDKALLRKLSISDYIKKTLFVFTNQLHKIASNNF